MNGFREQPSIFFNTYLRQLKLNDSLPSSFILIFRQKIVTVHYLVFPSKVHCQIFFEIIHSLNHFCCTYLNEIPTSGLTCVSVRDRHQFGLIVCRVPNSTLPRRVEVLTKPTLTFSQRFMYVWHRLITVGEPKFIWFFTFLFWILKYVLLFSTSDSPTFSEFHN